MVKKFKIFKYAAWWYGLCAHCPTAVVASWQPGAMDLLRMHWNEEHRGSWGLGHTRNVDLSLFR